LQLLLLHLQFAETQRHKIAVVAAAQSSMAARWITPKTTAVDESHKAQPLHCGLDTATRHVTTVAEAIVVAAADVVVAAASTLVAD
jgi:hypothetical protein